MPDLTNHLPIQPTPFIGREKEVAAVLQELLREDVRLVTLTGPGGVGKTRMALHVAEQLRAHFADGVWFVSLAPISDPDLVIPTIAQTLCLWEAGEQSPLEQLQVFLGEKQVLLLLDNFEQVVSAATHIANLLSSCPHLKVLVTSREVLHVRAEHEFPVPMLSLPDPKCLPDLVALSQYEAVTLFIQRAQAVRPEFQVTDANAEAVAEICVRLDGLPLAIELAAVRIKLLPPQALLTRLGQRLQLLTSNARDVPTRQQALRNTIQWSYDLLDAQEQRLFCLLSVFVGGCTLEAVEAVSAAVGDTTLPVLDGVASLIDKNLLQQTAPKGEEVRLLMLETIREYGWEALGKRQEREATQNAHAAYYLALAEEAERAFGGPQHLLWLERLGREYDNLRAALHWLRLQGSRVEGGGEAAEQALRLETALSWFWTIRGYQNDGRRRPRQLFLDLEETLSTEEAAPTPPSMETWQPPTSPARGTPPAPAGLTDREVEVLCLIAQGWTDAQIAEHLVISPRTVNRHTTSLYSKLGVSSRAAATRYAVEHHLL
jgi:predicted ATPase/DNA-binding CsgD family transcriptional regulator